MARVSGEDIRRLLVWVVLAAGCLLFCWVAFRWALHALAWLGGPHAA